MKFDISKVFKTAGNAVKKKGAKVGEVLHKASPDIFFWGGMAIAAAGAVYACIQSTKVEAIVDDANETKEEIKTLNAAIEERGGVVDAKFYKKQNTVIVLRTVGKIAKLYAVPFAMMGLGFGAMGYSHGFLKKENALLMTSLNATELAFDEYRRRVREELGDDKEYDICYGIKERDVIEEHTDEDGEIVSEKKRKRTNELNPLDKKSVIFDWHFNSWHDHDASLNFTVLSQMERYWQEYLDTCEEEVVMVNDILPTLGGRRRSELHGYGWRKGDIIKFGYDDRRNPQALDFMRGYNDTVLLTWCGQGGTPIRYIGDDW